MEQSIFTYCHRRINEAGGGWGFYSLSGNMEQYFSLDSRIKDYAGGAGYEIPKNYRVWLTSNITDYENDLINEEKSIALYHPEKFAYTFYDGAAVFTYAKNLGREIVNENRPANKLVYTLAGKPEEVSEYPCCYSDNDSFSRMNRAFFKNCDKTEIPAALPSVSVTPGSSVNYSTVQAFLNEQPEREELLIKLFYALINERSGKQRPILICDKKEDIIYWIAAVTMLFPKETAMNISFTTYDFLGTALGNTVLPQNVQLCGVYSPTVNSSPEEDATNYDAGNFEKMDAEGNIIKSEEAVLFDIECGILPEAETDDFEEVIRDFCRGDRRKLSDFFRYITADTSYRDFGKEYTKFYPAGQQSAELFAYYSNDVQKRMLVKCYPVLFAVNVEPAAAAKASIIVETAVKCKLMSENRLSGDIYGFIRKLFSDPALGLEKAEQVRSAAELVGLDIDSVIKDVFNEDPSGWVRAFTEDRRTPVSKLGLVLEVLNPFDIGDMNQVRRICNSLLDSLEGEKIVVSYIEKYINAHFDTQNPKADPQLLTALIDLSGVNTKIIEDILEIYPKWNNSYRVSAFAAFDESDIAGNIFEKLREMLRAGGKAELDAAYEITDILYHTQSDEFRDFYNDLILNLCDAGENVRKQVLNRLVLSPCCRPHPELEAVVDSVFRDYSFESPKELAEFSYNILCRIITGLNIEYPFRGIARAVNALDCPKRAWKKSVEEIKPLEFQVKCDREVKKMLIEDIWGEAPKGGGGEPGESAETEEKQKPGFFRKLFGK